jgi:hypothetical protein
VNGVPIAIFSSATLQMPVPLWGGVPYWNKLLYPAQTWYQSAPDMRSNAIQIKHGAAVPAGSTIMYTCTGGLGAGPEHGANPSRGTRVKFSAVSTGDQNEVCKHVSSQNVYDNGYYTMPKVQGAMTGVSYYSSPYELCTAGYTTISVPPLPYAWSDITMTRTFASGSIFAGSKVTLDGGASCEGTDEYGDHTCGTQFGGSFVLGVKLAVSRPIVSGMKMKIRASINDLIPIHATCDLCGGHSATIPSVPTKVTAPPFVLTRFTGGTCAAANRVEMVALYVDNCKSHASYSSLSFSSFILSFSQIPRRSPATSAPSLLTAQAYRGLEVHHENS